MSVQVYVSTRRPQPLPETLAQILCARLEHEDSSPVIGFFERHRGAFSTVSQADFLRSTLAAAVRLRGERGGCTPSHTLVTGASPKAQLTGYLASMWIGAVPTVMPTRPMASKAQRAELLAAARASLPNGTVVLDARHQPIEAATASPIRDFDLAQLLDEAVQRTASTFVHAQLSSGSTGISKAIAVTNANLLANCAAVSERWQVTAQDRIVSWLPLYHDLGLVCMALLAFIQGLDLYLMSPLDFISSPLNWLKAMSDVGGTISASPTFGYELVGRRVGPADIAPLDLSQWRVAACGGEPIHPSALSQFAERVAPAGFDPNALAPSYGLAEATLGVTGHGPGTTKRTLNVSRSALATTKQAVIMSPGLSLADDGDTIALVSCGTEYRDVAVNVVDPSGHTIDAENRCGEIVVSGPGVSPGYLDRNGNVTGFTDGTVATGDIGFVHDGELYIVDRLKNMIVRHGENFSANHLEAQIAAIVETSTTEVMVVETDILDPSAEIIAAIELARGQDPQEMIERFMAHRDQIDLRIDEIVVVGRGGLPTTTSGKKQHAELRARLASGDLRTKLRHKARHAHGDGDGDVDVDVDVDVLIPGDTKTAIVSRDVTDVIVQLCRSRGTSDLVTARADLQHELALDSLDLYEMAVALEEQIGVYLSDDVIGRLRTVGDVINACAEPTVDLTTTQSENAGARRSLGKQLPQVNLVVDEQQGRRCRIGARWVHDFASCNYLGLDLHEDVIAAIPPMIRQWGVHPSWSRAVASPRPYIELERRLAQLTGTADTLVFPTVTLLHQGVLPRLAGPTGTVLVDEEAHNSIQDAALLARARGTSVAIVPHNDVDAVRQHLAASRPGPRVIAIDGVYSMSGASPDLAAYQNLAREFAAVVYIDDAHGVGVLGRDPSPEQPFGRGGGGVVRHQGLTYDHIVYVGGLSKAFSSMAAFVACADLEQRDQFRMSSSLVFSGPIPVASLASAIAALEVNEREGEDLRAELHRLTNRLIEGCRRLDLVPNSVDGFPIVNVPLGSSTNVINACEILWKHGVLITPAVFPAAPLGQGGVRFSITAANTDDGVDRAIDALEEIAIALRRSGELIDLSEMSNAENLAR